jgi:starch synthase (maltosyl-transferring)
MKEKPHDRRRVAIERVVPELDCGRFPIKRTPGERVIVEADIFADGHNVLAGLVRYRCAAPGAAESWQEAPMRLLDNDRWQGSFTPERVGEYEYTIEAWIDAFGSWHAGMLKWVEAGQVAATDLLEGAQLLRAAAARARDDQRPTDADRLIARADEL